MKNNYPTLKARLTLANHKEITSEVIGRTPFEKPLKKSVSTDTIKKQLSKLDKYPYQITQININYDGTLFIPISKINELRRDLFEKLSQEVSNLYKHDYKEIKLDSVKNNSEENEAKFSFYTNNLNHLNKITGVERVYLEIPPPDDSLILKNEKHNLNYIISFIKKAIELSYNKDYKLIWKWPDIIHDDLFKSLNKARGILNKMHYSIPIMSNSFNGEYGPYSMNITNNIAVNSLENYTTVTLSPELRKSDYENIIENAENPEKIEMLVQGSVELMKTRYAILYGNERKKDYENYLIDVKNNKYPVHKSISGDQLIIFDNMELSLIEKINHLKKLGYSNFSIDGRFKNDDYYKIVNIYKEALNGNIDKKELEKYSLKNTLANF